MRWFARSALAQLCGASFALSSSFASAAAADNFYNGRQVTLIVSTDAGGGYASYANAFAPYLARHIAGQPRITIQYMPGAGGIRAMNYLYTSAPRDGSVIAMVHSGAPFSPLYGMAGAQFDAKRMSWLGAIGETASLCIFWSSAGIRTWQDVLTKPSTVGSSGAGSQMETFPVMLSTLFGAKIKVISGYRGGNEVYLAMERGEVDGRCASSVSSVNSTRPDWFTQKKVDVPIHLALERNPAFPEVPAIIEFAKDERTKQVLQFVLAPTLMDRPFLAPRGVPIERLRVLRAAFHEAVNDPQFLADAKRQRIEVKEISAEQIERVIADTYAVPADVVKFATESMNLSAGIGAN